MKRARAKRQRTKVSIEDLDKLPQIKEADTESELEEEEMEERETIDSWGQLVMVAARYFHQRAGQMSVDEIAELLAQMVGVHEPHQKMMKNIQSAQTQKTKMRNAIEEARRMMD